MWVALRLRTSGVIRVAVLGQVLREEKIEIGNPEVGEIGVLSVYKTKRQAVKDNPKGTPIMKFVEVKRDTL